MKGMTTESEAAWAAKGADGEAGWGLGGSTPMEGSTTEGAVAWVTKGVQVCPLPCATEWEGGVLGEGGL